MGRVCMVKGGGFPHLSISDLGDTNQYLLEIKWMS